MPLSPKLGALESLPHAPASDVKKLGWRGVMKTIARQGKLVVTNHNTPEAVILSAEEYAAIIRALGEVASRDEATLTALREQFDARLASLQAPDAAERLRALLREPAALDGRVKAGASY